MRTNLLVSLSILILIPIIITAQLGTCSLKQLHHYFNDNWEKIQSEIVNSKLIIAKENYIECIK